MSSKKTTPVMRQFLDAKEAHPDAILFFRLGDFYEMFYDDAVLVARLLGLTLTSRNKGAPDEVPMAGVPHHAAHGYVAKLLAHGHKVALCEQMADPSKVKGIVPRQVVRVITPGLVTDGDQLDEKQNHYLAAIDGAVERLGLALLDLSTGELSAASFDAAAPLLAELGRADPREILLGDTAPEIRAPVATMFSRAACRDDEPLETRAARALIDLAVDAPLFGDLEGHHDEASLRAIARVLRFAAACTPGKRLPIRRVAAIEASDCLAIDETALSHLEIVKSASGDRDGSLLSVIDATVTAAGARLLRRRLCAPLLSVGEIRRRHDQVEVLVVHARARDELRTALSGVTDLERLTVRVELGEASPRDLGGIRDGLASAPAAEAAIARIPEPSAREILAAEVDLVPELLATLAAALSDRPPPHAREGGFVRDGFDEELDRLRGRRKGGTEDIVGLEADLRRETGIPSLRVKYTRVFGWYVEITKSHLAKVPRAWRRKQTVATGERYTFDALDQLAADVESADERALERELAIFDALTQAAREVADRVRALAARLATWDVAAALADVAHRYDYARPTVDESDRLAIEAGRHAVVERTAAAGRFVPNDTVLDAGGKRLWLVTGPNMAGKSTLMRQVALITILAQMGSYVPAKSAHVGLVDRVLSRVGASDNLARGESTFMVEMRETAAILRAATRRSLVIVDEIGRGTSTYDGLAIAWAVAEHLHDAIRCRALFATHYHELTELEKAAGGVANVSVSARERGEEVVFLHTLVSGPASRSYGVAVAKLAGIPESVLCRARAMLASLEAGGAGRTRAASGPQLGLFERGEDPARDEARQVIETLKVVDIDRLTPLDALTLLAKLKAMTQGSPVGS